MCLKTNLLMSSLLFHSLNISVVRPAAKIYFNKKSKLLGKKRERQIDFSKPIIQPAFAL